MSEEKEPSKQESSKSSEEKSGNTFVLASVAIISVLAVVVIALMMRGSNSGGGSSYSYRSESSSSERQQPQYAPPPAPAPLPAPRIERRPQVETPPPPPSTEEQEAVEAFKKGERLGRATRELLDTVDNVDQEAKQRKATGQENLLRDFKNMYDVGRALGEFGNALKDLDSENVSSAPKDLFVPDGWQQVQRKKKISEERFELGGVMVEGNQLMMIGGEAFRTAQDPLLSLQQYLAANKQIHATEPERDNDERGAGAWAKSPDGKLEGVVYMFRDREWTYLFITVWPKEFAEYGGKAFNSILQGMFKGE